MEAVFLKLLNMSITASWLVLAVVVLRLLLKKAPKALVVVMWASVGIRLICPFSFESVLSLIPSAETIPSDILYSDTPAIQSGISSFDSKVNPIISETFAPNIGNSVNPIRVIAFLASYIWIAGMVVMLLYMLISYLRIQRKVREAIPLENNTWLCDNVSTPFILGVIRPRIYLSSSMKESDVEYALAHEMAHLKRHDHWWKPIGFALLTIYWFNPILWIAYILFCRDIEFACDEKVLKEMGTEVKQSYSHALINCSVPRKMITACPLAFGEVGVKRRIKYVLNYKLPVFWVILVAIITCVGVGVCFLTNPDSDKALSEAALIDADVEEGIEEKYTINADGTYSYKGKRYKYKVVLLGKGTGDSHRTQYTVLTDDQNIAFETVRYRESSNSLKDTVVIDARCIDSFSEEEISAAKAVVEEYFRARKVRDRKAALATLFQGCADSSMMFWQDEVISLEKIRYLKMGVSIACEPGEYRMDGETGTINGIAFSDFMTLNVDIAVNYEKGQNSAYHRGKLSRNIVLARDDEGEWYIYDFGLARF